MAEKTFLITDYGAQPDTETAQTAALQACIDACRHAGGGTIVIPGRHFTTGSIRLYSHMTLHLAAGAVLQGSRQLADYTTFGEQTDIRYLQDPHYVEEWHLPPYYFHALICAYDAEDITISGAPGNLIDGRSVQDPDGEEKFRGPMGIVMARVQGLRLSGYTVTNASNWANVLPACQDVTITDVTVLGGHDGFDLHHARRVTMTHCRLETGDDCIAGYDIHGLTVTDCLLNTACNALRVGGEDITVDRCTFQGPGRYPHILDGSHATLNAFMYFTMAADPDTTTRNTLTIRHARIDHLQHLATYLRDEPTALQAGSSLAGLTLDDVTIGGMAETSLFVGRGEPVALTLQDCRITPTPGVLLLHIDPSVRLTLKDVFFTAPTTFLVTDGPPLTFCGLTNFSTSEQSQQS